MLNKYLKIIILLGVTVLLILVMGLNIGGELKVEELVEASKKELQIVLKTPEDAIKQTSFWSRWKTTLQEEGPVLLIIVGTGITLTAVWWLVWGKK